MNKENNVNDTDFKIKDLCSDDPYIKEKKIVEPVVMPACEDDGEGIDSIDLGDDEKSLKLLHKPLHFYGSLFPPEDIFRND